jgi:NhaP-type Na+/H+ or K+/H+ antiporter
MTENQKTNIVAAIAGISIRAVVTVASVGVFLGIVGGFLPAEHIEESGAIALVTTAFYFGKES